MYLFAALVCRAKFSFLRGRVINYFVLINQLNVLTAWLVMARDIRGAHYTCSNCKTKKQQLKKKEINKSIR